MTGADAINIFHAMTKDNVVYAYHGDFNYAVVNTLLVDIKKELHKNTDDIRSAKKTYKVLVECLENIHKHSSRRNEISGENNEGIFVLIRDPKGYVVAIGNSIEDNEVAQLKAHLDEINDLDAESLKAKYKESLKQSRISDKGGAGMGMIDIAMKSGNILDYTFNDYKENRQFFSLKVLIENQK
ncbi:MAG: hypothetical protein ACI8QQ_002603 [Psychroserpens sp.]|jgi:hypothetical protein